jgi:DtxR family transcriptional regulator, Mn-dependent transcriptional regulator
MSQHSMPKGITRAAPCAAADAAGRQPACCSLCALRLRQPATIHTMTCSDACQVRYLATLGLLPQACIQVEERAPFGGPLLVKVGGARYALGRDVADGIIVTPD